MNTESVDRIPIHMTERKQETQKPPILNVVAVGNPWDIRDFMPRKGYKFDGAVVSTESDDLKEMFKVFLEENAELVNSDITTESDTEGYIHGFRNAVAILHLWIDSMYITELSNG